MYSATGSLSWLTLTNNRGIKNESPHNVSIFTVRSMSDKDKMIIILNFTQDLNPFRQGKDLYYGVAILVWWQFMVAIHPFTNY